MSLSNALFSSVTGLNTTSTAISVIGDNIANVGTPGFKERRAEFADVLGQSIATSGGFSQTGAGAKVSRVTQVFTQGSFESTERPTDLAIEGRGFFIAEGPLGRTYTRAGLFGFDNEGVLTDANGWRIQGFTIDPNTLQPTGQLGDIVAQSSLASPQLTSTMDLSLNLDANAPLVGAPFDLNDPGGTSNHQATISVFDSLGNAHPTTLYFQRTGAGTWDWFATLPPNPAPGPVQVQGNGTLTFDVSGELTAVTGTNLVYNFGPGTLPNQPITLSFGPVAGLGTGSPTTQYSSPYTVNSATQDGFSAGTLQGIDVDSEGFVVAIFSNGETRPLAQLGLATFPNIEGLQAIGNNSFVESRASGQPLVGAAQTGQFGSIRSANIEQSNVDLAAQFIRLILNQRAFQANTRTVSTTNELLANLVQLGQ